MALITCRECGNEVSSAAATCPRCGIDCPSAEVKREQIAGKVVRAILVVLIVGGGVYSCARLLNTDIPPTTVEPSAMARDTCRTMLRALAKNPTSAEIPYARDIGSGGTHQFVWHRGDGLTMMNAFGANLDTSASCTTNAAGTEITALVVNDETVL